ncbi:MAG: hypothetical protein ACOZNI_26150 [Myxococcota bacterium]
MWLVLSSCWRPDPWEPPPPPPEALEAMGVAEEEAVAEAPDVEEPAVEEPATPETVLWRGATKWGRLSLVDDGGRTVGRIEAAGVAVEVLREEPQRVKVRCATCSPPVEGWLQAALVVKE